MVSDVMSMFQTISNNVTRMLIMLQVHQHAHAKLMFLIDTTWFKEHKVSKPTNQLKRRKKMMNKMATKRMLD